MFNNIEKYLEYQKENGTLQHEKFTKEIILVSSANMRLGDSIYWLHNLNKHYASTSFMILTEPTFTNNELLMKPFLNVNNVKTFHSPIDPNLSASQLCVLINHLRPKRLICPQSYVVQDIISLNDLS